MIFIKIIADLGYGVLNALGGYHWIWARRFIMPFLIGLMVSLQTQIWWCGILVLPSMGTLCLGYFSGHNWGRALWLFVQSVSLSLGLLLFGHLYWYFFVPYIIGAGILGGLYKNWKQEIGDFITGCYLGIIILLIH